MQQIIYIDKKKYAVNLVWQPVADGFVARNYAKRLTNDIDKKLNLYSEYRGMICLGSLKMGHRNGMPIAAAEIIDVFSEYSSFLGAFKTGNGFWVVAVRNGIVLEDKLFEDELSATEEYKKLFEIPDWDGLFAPNSWGIPRALDKNLENVISGNVRVVLKSISRFKSNLTSFILIVLFVLGLGQFFKGPIVQIVGHKKQISNIDPNLAQEYKKQLENKKNTETKKIDAENQKKQNPEIVIMPYDVLPDPNLRAKLCYQSIGFLMQSVPGWNQVKLQCRETYTDVTFKRNFGNMDDFYEIVTDKMPGVLIEEKSKSEIYVKTNLPLLPAQGSLEEKDVQTISRQVNTLFQKIDSVADVDITMDTFSDNGQSWNINVVEISAESKLIPQEFIKIFSDFSGVYMNLAEWDTESKTWNYEVIIYAK